MARFFEEDIYPVKTTTAATPVAPTQDVIQTSTDGLLSPSFSYIPPPTDTYLRPTEQLAMDTGGGSTGSGETISPTFSYIPPPDYKIGPTPTPELTLDTSLVDGETMSPTFNYIPPPSDTYLRPTEELVIDTGGGSTGGGGTDTFLLPNNPINDPTPPPPSQEEFERRIREARDAEAKRRAAGYRNPSTARQGNTFGIGRTGRQGEANASAFLGRYLPERAGKKVYLKLDDFRYGLITKFKRGMRPLGSLEDVQNFLINKTNGALVQRHGYTEHITGTITDISGDTTLSTILAHKQVSIERPFAIPIDVLAVNTGAANGTFFQKPFFHNSSSALQKWVNVNEKVSTTISGAPVGNTFVLTAGEATDDYYNGWVIRNTTESQSMRVADYVGSTKTITVVDNLPSGWTSGDSVTLARYFHDEVGDFTNDWGSVYAVSTSNPSIIQTGESYIACGGRTASANVNVLPYRSDYLDKTFFNGATTNGYNYRYQGTYCSKMHIKSDLGITLGAATETSPGGTGLDANKRYFYMVVAETDDGQLGIPIYNATNYLTPSTTGKGLSFTCTIHYPMLNKRIRFLNVFLGETDKTSATSLEWKNMYFVRQLDLIDNQDDDGNTSIFVYTATVVATPGFWQETVSLDEIDWAQREENLLEFLGVPAEYSVQSVPFNRATTVDNLIIIGDFYDQAAGKTVPDGIISSVPASGAGVPQINVFPGIEGYTRSLVASGDPAIIQNLANYQGKLFVAKTNACYAVTITDDPTTWKLEKIADIGCDTPRSVVTTPYGVCWVNSEDDIWMWSGGYPRSLTNNTIQPTFREFGVTNNLSDWSFRTPAENNSWQSVCWSPELGIFCAVSSTGTNRVMTSPDGITWTARAAAAANTWRTVCWSPDLGLFCAVTFNGIMTSPDGINWTSRTPPTPVFNTWFSVCWSPELGIFCAVSQDGTNRAMTSSDGITWTSSVVAEQNTWVDVCWSPELSLFCAVSTDGTNRVMTSPDGVTWTARAAAEANRWFSVTWSPGLNLFCAVAETGTNRVMTSPDGITWTARAAAEANTWYDVTWAQELGLFVAVSSSGTNRAMSSADGITWRASSVAASNDWIDVAWSPDLGLFCAVSSNAAANSVMTAYGYNTWHSFYDSLTRSYNLTYDDHADRKTIYSTFFDIPVMGNFAWLKHRLADNSNSVSLNYFGEALFNTGTEVMKWDLTALDDAGTDMACFFDTGEYTLDEKDLVALQEWHMALENADTATWANNLDVKFLMNGTAVTLGGTNPLTSLTKTNNFFKSGLPLDSTALGRRIQIQYNTNATKATVQASDDSTPLTILEVGVFGEARRLIGSQAKSL